jgi:hypothetical protein
MEDLCTCPLPHRPFRRISPHKGERGRTTVNEGEQGRTRANGRVEDKALVAVPAAADKAAPLLLHGAAEARAARPPTGRRGEGGEGLPSSFLLGERERLAWSTGASSRHRDAAGAGRLGLGQLVPADEPNRRDQFFSTFCLSVRGLVGLGVWGNVGRPARISLFSCGVQFAGMTEVAWFSSVLVRS